jgi:hypothetical protein
LLVSRDVEIEKQALIGKSHEHRRLTLKDQQGGQVDALWWNSASEVLPDGRFDIAYYARRDTFKGAQGVILEWVDQHESDTSVVDIHQIASRYRILDHRFESGINAVLEQWTGEPVTLIWAEGPNVSHIPAVTRFALKPSNRLVILTPPPSMAVLNQALKLVSPVEVILFSMQPADDSLQGFLKEIARQTRNGLANGQTEFSILHFAGDLGQTTETILAGWEWWRLRGELEYSINDDRVSISRASSHPSPKIQSHTMHLQNLLKETAAFRSYYRRADPAVLLDWAP